MALGACPVCGSSDLTSVLYERRAAATVEADASDVASDRNVIPIVRPDRACRGCGARFNAETRRLRAQAVQRANDSRFNMRPQSIDAMAAAIMAIVMKKRKQAKA